MPAYVPPSKRIITPLVNSLPISLNASNFPSFGTIRLQKPTLNFLEKVQIGEQERIRQERQAFRYDPSKINILSCKELENEGWAILNLNIIMTRDYVIRWNNRVCFGMYDTAPELPSEPEPIEIVEYYDGESEYSEEDDCALEPEY
jgi:hypothetical protein